MGTIDDKREVFNQIGVLTSIKDDTNITDPKDSLLSINNSKEIVPFMLDILTVLVGSTVLKRLTGELMTNFIRTVEPTLKNSLKKQLVTFNSETVLPVGFEAGYTVPAKDIDSFGVLKVDPASKTGSLLYPQNTNNFNKKSYEAIVVPDTKILYNNIDIKYTESSDSFTYTPSVGGTQTIGSFTESYIDNIILIDEKEFTANIINSSFGTITTSQNKSVESVLFEEKINKTIQKVIDNEENIAITEDELIDLEKIAQDKVDGIEYLDVGCGVLQSVVTLDDLNNLINITTGNTDPLTVGNAYSDIVANSFNNTQQTQAQQDNETIQDGFFKRLINTIVNILVSALITTPQIRAILGIVGAFKNNDNVTIGNAIDDLNNKQDLITCLSNSAKSTINEFIFKGVKRELIKLIVPVSTIILKEKINQYLRIIKSLSV